MNSDGADEDSAQLIAQTAASESSCDINELVNRLGSMILDRRQGARADDITVIAVRIGTRKD